MELPKRLGKYPITGILGKGAMGVVYRGHDPVIKRQVAIKTIHRQFIHDDDKAEAVAGRFRKEAQAAGALSHPGIVSVYEYGEDADYAYIAMECVEGKSLGDYFNLGVKFELRDATSIMAQLLEALEYAHVHSVWHRDIKPANIIIMSSGRVKLADFGVARIETFDRTQTNMLLGTPGYIAPEYYLGAEIDHRVDIFSSGVVFYQLLTGQAPFRGTPESIMHSVCYLDPDPPSDVEPLRCPPQFDTVIARALMKKPEDRYPSAGALRAAILAAHAEPLADAVSESTIIMDAVRPSTSTPGPGTPHGSTPRNPGSGPTAATQTPPPTGWEAPVLANVERELAKFVGPIARVLVRRAAREQRDLPGLATALTESLPTATERDAFVAAVLGRATASSSTIARTSRGTINQGTLAIRHSMQPLSGDDVAHVTGVLASYIGPIAKVITKRAANAQLGRHDFIAQVAQSVESEVDRGRFLREIGA